jgi:hypothetical protein
MGSLMKLRKSDMRQLGVADPSIAAQIEQLFYPPVIWKFRQHTRTKLNQLTTQSARNLTKTGAITAAVSRYTMDGSWKNYSFGDRAWQTDAWRLYDITGQLRFIANWVGNSIGRCDLYVADALANGVAGEPVEDPEIADLANVPLGTGDTRAENLRLAGIDMFVCGEAYIVAETGTNNDTWWVVTNSQINKQGKKILISRPPTQGGTLEYKDGKDLILRIWTQHPRDTNQPDSSVRAAIPDLRELEALRKRIFAELDSRLAGAGLLALPDTMDLPHGDDEPAGAQGFSALLGRIMSQSLQDRSSAASMVPIITTGAAEDIEKIRHITFWSELSTQIPELRQSALASLAQSLDVPPEVMIGIGSSTNHWNAWAISREAVQVHIKPILTRIAAALTEGYLKPALETMGLDPTKYCFAFNTAPLTINPDRSQDALGMHDRLLISDQVARESSSWEETTQPTQDERARRLTEKLLLSSPEAVLGDPALRELIGLPAGTGVPVESGSNQPTEPAPEPAPVEGPPEEPTTTEPNQVAAIEAASTTLAEIAARRYMSLAGAKLVPHRERPSDVPRWNLHTVHGPTEKADLLVPATWREEFTGLGFDEMLPGIERHCMTLLYQGIPFESGQVVNA